MFRAAVDDAVFYLFATPLIVIYIYGKLPVSTFNIISSKY